MKPSSEEVPVSSAQVAGLLAHLGRIGVGYLPSPDRETAAAIAAARTMPAESTEALASVDRGNRENAAAGDRSAVVPPVTTGDAGQKSIDAPYVGPSLSAAERAARLAELANRVAGCTACTALACSRRSTVFGEGDPMAKICFLGEAPGQEEDASGRPFVGRSGELLTKMIEACTLSRSEVYILNVIKCRPPSNRTPEPEEVANCRPYFAEQLQIIRPDYIVCLGLVAARSLLHSDQSVGRLRGRFHRYHDSKVVVTYHPSYLLRTPAVKKEAWSDLQMLMKDYGIDLSQIHSQRPRR